MRVSDVYLTDHPMCRTHRVETQTDAIAIISNDFQLRSYIEQYGDVVIEFDYAFNVWRVPEFAGVIARYSAAKQIECDRWGCE